MQTELSITAFERKLERVYSWAFFKRYSEGYEKPFAEAYAEGYAAGLKEAIISLKRTIDPGILAERLEISVEDVLDIWEQS